MKKAYEAMEQLMRAGFDMTTKEFFETTVSKVLRKHGVDMNLSEEEYRKLLGLILEQCAENDLKNMGISYTDGDNWKDK